MKTLALRMEAHCRNARRVAEFLAGHPRVVRTYYPGLSTHPGHDLAARQMRDFGGMVAFELESAEEATAVCERTTVFFLAESLGGVESSSSTPAA